MNQASRKSWLVPVLPAAIQPGISALRAVPESRVSCIIVFMAATWRGSITWLNWSGCRTYSSLPSLVRILVTTCGETPSPPLANGAYAPTSSMTETSEVPSAIEGLARSEEHTSELQSHSDLVCRLLLEKKKRTDEKEATRTMVYSSTPD